MQERLPPCAPSGAPYTLFCFALDERGMPVPTAYFSAFRNRMTETTALILAAAPEPLVGALRSSRQP